MARVHSTAVVDARAEVAGDAFVGPYAIVEAGTIVGPGCVLHAHAVVRTGASLGPRNVVHPFAVIGGEPQSRKQQPDGARVEVDESNVFREHVTVHGGSEGRSTRIGRDNLFMVGSHVAHDAHVGSHCVLANGVQVAGHAMIGDWVTFGGLSGVTQHVHVGESAFVAATAACERDVPPFVVVQGDRARVRGINVVGLRRRGIPEESIRALRRAARILWSSGATRAEALRALSCTTDPWVRALLQSLQENVS